MSWTQHVTLYRPRDNKICEKMLMSVFVCSFVCRLYATKVMIGCVESELKAMRSGLHDVIPAELLSSLTPEVSRLSFDQQ